MDNLQEIALWLWSLDGVKFIVGHTLVNVAVAISAAVRDESDGFQFARLLDFLGKKLTPYVLVFGVAQWQGADAGLDWLAPAAWVLIEVTLTADLADNLKRLGVPVPERVLGLLGKDE